MRILVLVFALTAWFIPAKGQNSDTLSYPEVGKPMPDLLIKNIAYYSKKQANIRDFRGKWLILDFWDINCSACIASFPRMNKIQRTFSRQLQVLLVGVEDPESKIQSLFAKFRDRQHLVFPCAFDSSIAQRLDLYYMPHTIVIDDNGIVRSVVVSIDTVQVRQFLEGKSPKLPQTYRRMKDYDTVVDRHIPFNNDKPLQVNGNGANDTAFVYRSLLSDWDPTVHSYFDPFGFDMAVKSGRFQLLGANLEMLYNYAYFGHSSWGTEDTLLYRTYYDHPVLVVRDSSLLDNARRYCYSLIRPTKNNTEKIMMTSMQRDLANFFGLNVNFEIRKCPYWKIIASPGTNGKLGTKGGEMLAHELSLAVGWTMRNASMGNLVECISGHNPGHDKLRDIYLDETGIIGNIDITMDCIMSDLDDVRRALQANGLDLVKGEKEMHVLVIRDSPHF
jgi:peroxiredoxin